MGTAEGLLYMYAICSMLALPAIAVSALLKRSELRTEKTKRIAADTPDDHAIGVLQRFKMLGYVVHEKWVEPRASRVNDLMGILIKGDVICLSCKAKQHRLYEFIDSETPGLAVLNDICDFCPTCGACETRYGIPRSILEKAIPRPKNSNCTEFSNLHDLIDLMERKMEEITLTEGRDVTPNEALAAIVATKCKALPEPEAATSPSS